MDITPSEYPFYTFGGRKADYAVSPVYTTCVVVYDGQEFAYFLTTDVRAAEPHMVKKTKETIRNITGTDEDHIFYCTTHNHSGPIRTASKVIHAPLKEVSEDMIAKAKEVADCTDAEKRKELRIKYGFENRAEASAILNTVRRRGIYGDIIPIRHVAISFGDIGFALAPFEMFHGNGKQARDGSPFPMTFISANTDGSMSYVPTIEAVPHGGYEVYNSSVIPGTGERCAQTMAKLLQQTKQ